MSIYHCSIKIISRAGGRSAVASAAYRSGEKLYNEETGIIHDFNRKGGVIMSEIILPVNAPSRYMDREILWNEVQQIEKRSDAQFAREVEVALPVEMTRDEQIECVRNYINDNFVSVGMIADWALHDKGDGNPHAHIMLTMRGMDEHEQWLQKQKSVFANARDESGKPIYNPDLPLYNPADKKNTEKYRIPVLDENGEQKKRVRSGKGCEYLWEKISIPANDWNEHSKAEIWRRSWAEHCNRYLDENSKIDHRSYERQGIDKEPTIHEGVVARQMEKDGRIAERCQINRDVRERNSIREEMVRLAKEITEAIITKAGEIIERFKGIRGSVGAYRDAAGDDRDYGVTGSGDRDSETGKQYVKGTVGRINGFKRTVKSAVKETEDTDREIAETDNAIERIARVIMERKESINERLKRLRERRTVSQYDGESAGRGGIICDTELTACRGELDTTGSELKAFIRELNTKERASEEKRDDSISERADREAGESRYGSERERETDTKREGNQRKSKSH